VDSLMVRTQTVLENMIPKMIGVSLPRGPG